ncbi:hypothetical protein GCM10023333_35270 [Ferrimonas pelagia]|uniref:Uncharacterized protein n=1 Tax=Ferrimonas pelagia TaxID=1177826 RepID=A0ABP9FBU2_9GAMM
MVSALFFDVFLVRTMSANGSVGWRNGGDGAGRKRRLLGEAKQNGRPKAPVTRIGGAISGY